jgi:ABC-type multidrug transport system fused ATPase/permease subunit
VKDSRHANSARAIFRRVQGLLDGREKRIALGLMAAVFVNSFVDLLGLAAVIPVIGLVVEPELITSNAILGAVYDVAYANGIGSEKHFLTLLCILLIAAFLFKTLFGIWLNHVQSKFAFRVAHRMSGEVWLHHFSDSLERMRSKESGRILTEINSWPVLFARVFITGGQLLINELVVMVLLAIGLTAYDPLVFVGVAGIIGAGGLLIRLITKRQLEHNSATIQRLAPTSSSLVQNAVRGFLELITFRAVQSVQRNYLGHTRELYTVHSRQMVLGIIPTRLYELLAVTALCGIIVLSLIWGETDASFFETLSLLGLSAYRVMPAMARANSRLIAMRGQMHLLDAMENAGLAATDTSTKETSVERIALDNPVEIQVRDLTLAYEGHDPVVKGLDASFTPGQIHTVTGASGSGKSTLISALLGLHKPQSGDVLISGKSLGQEISSQQWLGHVAYLAQQPFLFSGTIRDNLTLGVQDGTLDEARVLDLMKRLHLTDTLGPDPLQFQLNEGGSNLSGGQQQRLALIRALQLTRPVLILDEATSSLDSVMRNAVLELLGEEAQRGTTVLLVTHDAEIAQGFSSVKLA